MILLDLLFDFLALLGGIVVLTVVLCIVLFVFPILRSIAKALMRGEFRMIWRGRSFIVSIILSLFGGAFAERWTPGGAVTKLVLGSVTAVGGGYLFLALVFHRVRWSSRVAKPVLCFLFFVLMVDVPLGSLVADGLQEVAIVSVLSGILTWVVLYERDVFKSYLSKLIPRRGVRVRRIRPRPENGKPRMLVVDSESGDHGIVPKEKVPRDAGDPDIGPGDSYVCLDGEHCSPPPGMADRGNGVSNVASIEISGVPESYFTSKLGGASQGDGGLVGERDVASRFRAFVTSLLMSRRVFALKLVFSGGRGRLFIECREPKAEMVGRVARDLDSAFHSCFPDFDTRLHLGDDGVAPLDGEVACGSVWNLPAPSLNPMRIVAELFIHSGYSGCVTVAAQATTSKMPSKYRKGEFKRLAEKASKGDQQIPWLELISRAITSTRPDFDAQKELEYRAKELERMTSKVQAKCWVTVECEGATYDDAEMDLDLVLRGFVSSFTYEGRHESMRYRVFPRRRARVIHELTSRLEPRGDSTVLLPSDLALYFWLPQCDTIARVKRKGDFLAPTREETLSGEIFLGNVVRHGIVTAQKVFLRVEELMRHLQIVGGSGGGKTLTSQRICLELAKQGIPFIVFNPVKKDWRGLIDVVPGLRVFTVGDETVAPLRFNILRVPQGCKVQRHIDLVHDAIVASVVMYPPAPYVLQMALNETYAKFGWDALRSGRGRDFSLPDLNPSVEEIVRRKRYEGEVKANIAAALSTRFESLAQGGKGTALCSSLSMSPKELIERPTVVELSEMGSQEDRALVILMMLMSIHEYLATLGQTSKPRCAIVIEEAGSLFARAEGKGAVDYTGSEARGKAVQTISDVVSTIRSLGGIVIFVNQSAVNLPLEVSENTSTKIVHQVVDDQDGGKVARMFGLDVDQGRALSSLEVGRAILKVSWVSHPFQVQVADLSEFGVDLGRPVPDDVVRDYMGRTFYADHPEYLHAKPVKASSPLKRVEGEKPLAVSGDFYAWMTVASAGFREKYAKAIKACTGSHIEPLADLLWEWMVASGRRSDRAVKFGLAILIEATARFNDNVATKSFRSLYGALKVELSERASTYRFDPPRASM